MKRYKAIISSVLFTLLFTACQKDFLDKYPLDEITEAAFFKQPNDLKIYMNQYYDRSVFPLTSIGSHSDVGMDTYISEAGIDSRLQGTRTVNSAPSLNYSRVRSVNYFFDNYRKCEADFEEYKQYVGEAHFFRAMFYYDLLRTFGGVPWITTALNTDSPELYSERATRNVIADNIIADLDTAAMYLNDSKTNGCSRINKWVALLIQSRVALYEGTWEKYHAGDPFGVSNSQPDKYLNKSLEASTAIMNSGLYDIYTTGAPLSDYVDLFALRDYTDNPEVLFWNKMSTELSIFSQGKLYRLSTPSGFGLTKSMADAYLCNDGEPISTSLLFQGHGSIADEQINRDPRFYQTIFTPDSPWMIDLDGNITNFEDEYMTKLFSNTTFACPTGYVRRKDYNPDTQYHAQNYEITPSIQYRYAEVLLNYAEAKAELGTISQADIDISIKKLRDRVGMPNLTIGSITTDVNWEYPSLSPVINEIRRERKVEMVMENIRWDDIARWAAADEVIVGKRPKGELASQFALTPTYATDNDGFLDPFQSAMPNGYGFVIDRDYLSPISKQEIELNPKLTQNPGW